MVIDEKLLKVPLDVFAARILLQKVEERQSIRAVHIHLGEQIEGHTKLGGNILLNFSIRLWFLAAKLIARKD